MKQLTDPRQLRGLEILSKPETVREVKKNHWMVRSQSGNGEYEVISHPCSSRNNPTWTCTCPDHQTRNVVCKHIFCVQFSLKIRDEIKQDAAPRLIEAIETRVACPFCKSMYAIARGKRKTGFGEVQRYGCKDCGHRFTIDKGFSQMKHDPKIITLALDLWFKELSYRKISDHIKQFHNINICQTTLMRWIKKYLKLLAKYGENHKAEVGKIWHTDETTVFIKKEGDKKYYQWIWNVMDSKTRFLLACQVTETRFVKDAQRPLRQAKAAANIRPDVIVTDGLKAYSHAIKNEFYDPNEMIVNPHLRLKDFETHPNNNILERLNGTFRERTKVLRSFDSPDGASEFCDGMRVYYNYIRPHQGIGGLTPAQMANIPIDLMGNRWEKMIELANGE